MARVKNPLFSEEAHGALDGIEFRTSRYGNIVGRRSMTPRRSTAGQQLVRQYLAWANHSWDQIEPLGFRYWYPITDARKAWWTERTPQGTTPRAFFCGRWARMRQCFYDLEEHPTEIWTPTTFTIDQIGWFYYPPWTIYALFSYVSGSECQVRMRIQPTNPSSKSPDPRKWRWAGSSFASGLYIEAQHYAPMPCYWVSIDALSLNDGCLFFSHIVKLER